MKWRRIALLGGILATIAAAVGGWYELRQLQIARQAQSWKSQGIAAAQAGDADQEKKDHNQ